MYTMKKLIAISTSVLIFLSILLFPVVILASTNYGDGTYGGGNYNVGDTPTPAPVTASNTAGAPECTETTPTGPTPWLYEANGETSSSLVSKRSSNGRLLSAVTRFDRGLTELQFFSSCSARWFFSPAS